MPRGRNLFLKLAAAGSLASVALLSTGCSRLINGPDSAHHVEERPTEIADFDALYGQNCAACHGERGVHGPSVPLNNPLYMAIASDDTMRQDITNGGPGHLMPAFGESAGGFLTPKQVDILVQGMRARWAKPAMFTGATLPPYAASHPGNASAGEPIYKQAFASWHGQSGKDGSLTDPTFLSLISDQGLRTLVIAGRPDLNVPDYRDCIPGHPLTDEQITDVVAYLSSLRPAQPATSVGMSPEPAASQPSTPLASKPSAKAAVSNKTKPVDQSSGSTGTTQQ